MKRELEFKEHFLYRLAFMIINLTDTLEFHKKTFFLLSQNDIWV